jgi:hypothetical protein
VFEIKKGSKIKPTEKGFYAWTSLYAGSFLLYVEELRDYYKFVFLPGPNYMNLTHETFQSCIATKTLEYVETVPDDVFNETIKLTEKSVALSSPILDSSIDEKNAT